MVIGVSGIFNKNGFPANTPRTTVALLGSAYHLIRPKGPKASKGGSGKPREGKIRKG